MEDTGTTLAKARQDLENLYFSIPEDSVELTLKDLPSFQQSTKERKIMTNMEPIREEQPPHTLDFFVGRSPAHTEQLSRRRSRSTTTLDNGQLYGHVGAQGVAGSPLDETQWGRGRPGIPHSNICALCSVTIHIFRHRCLVCGRVYCKKCLDEGMGEMTEGRKCVECLGIRFSQRYIQKAGTGCYWRYSRDKKRQELKWAEKGPRRGSESQHGKSPAGSRSRTSLISRKPTTRSYASGSVSPAMSRNSSTSHAGDNLRYLATNTALTSGHRGYPM